MKASDTLQTALTEAEVEYLKRLHESTQVDYAKLRESTIRRFPKTLARLAQ